MNIVKLSPPTGAQDIVALFEGLLVRARAGEFETVLIVAFEPTGKWLTVERGAKLERLRAVGILESMKADLLQSTETDEPSGL